MAIQRTGDSLVAVIDLWELVAEILGVTLKQSADFVEKRVKSFDVDLWIDDEYSGLWTPCEKEDAIGRNQSVQYLLDAWSSAESKKWNLTELQGWFFLKMDVPDSLLIKGAAIKIRDAGKTMDIAHAIGDVIQIVASVQTELDPTDLPFELDAANMAYRAVLNGYGDKTDTFKNRLIAYLQVNYTDLKSEAVQRIATVANPDKTAGRKKRDKE